MKISTTSRPFPTQIEQPTADLRGSSRIQAKAVTIPFMGDAFGIRNGRYVLKSS